MRLTRFVFVFAVLFAGCGEKVVEETQPPPTGFPGTNPFQSVVVTGNTVNLRQGPGTVYTVVGTAMSGDTLLVTGEAPDWYRVCIPGKSLFAWIYSPLTTGAEMPGEER